MDWFGPKLEPGERVLLRDPALRDLWAAIVLAMSVMLLVTLFLLPGRVGEHLPSDLLGLVFFLGGSVGVTVGLASLSRAVKDGWVITDRRFISWRGPLRRKAEEMCRDKIDSTTLDGDDLLVHDDGRVMRLDLRGVSDAALLPVLGTIAPPPGHKAERLKRIVENGENVILRHPAIWNWAIPGAMALLVAILLLFWTGKWLGWFSTPSARGNPASLAVVLLALPILAKHCGDAAWSAVVTDRRVLLRRLHDRTRFDVIPLAAIEEIEAPHEGSHRVYLHANGQRYEFRLRSLPAAKHMYDTIERARRMD